MNKISNPFELRKTRDLQKVVRAATLAGGSEGSDVTSPEAIAASSADDELLNEATLAIVLGAVLDMRDAVNLNDRKLLDSAYETVITALEEWRDATPKA